MKYTVSTHGVKLSAYNKDQIGEKTARLEKYLHHPLPVEIVFRREGKGMITCTLMYGEGKHVLRAERTNHSLEDSLDEALGALKRELVKQHEKQRSQG